MTDYKPTFKVSPKKRPWYKRLTPLAWAMIGVGVVVLLLGITAVVLASGGRRTVEVWWTPTPTPTETPTATPTVGPSPTPTAWYEGMISPTPDPTPAHPAWWTDQMTQDEEGNWWPPEEVVEMVREAYNTTVEIDRTYLRTYLVETKLPDYEGWAQAQAEWNDGPELEGVYALADIWKSGKDTISSTDWETCILQVQAWSEDGLECTLGIVCQNGTFREYDPTTGELLRQEHRDSSGLALIRMRYDPVSGHWKRYELVDFIPPNQ